MHHSIRTLATALSVAVGCISGSAAGIEYPVGAPQQRDGMEIVAVYLQPVTMEPEGMMKPPAQSDIHLEADIHALADNPNGFGEGAWIPYLKVEYTLVKRGAPGKIAGVLMPMVASDGPHYGENVKLTGPGKYRLSLHISPPNAAGEHAQFGRHTDRLTGVQPWFKPFEVQFEFTFAGIGKKGSY
jgi:uncharacterized protein involved in high-affinity Fe2+ transport